MISRFAFGFDYYPQATMRGLEELVCEMESLFGRENRETLEAVDYLVGALMSGDKMQEAKNLAMSSYLRCYRVFGDAHVQTAFAAGNFGVASLHLDDLVSAEWGLSKATEILVKTFSESHQTSSTFLEPLAKTYERMGREHDAKTVRDKLISGKIGWLLQGAKS
jgi:hypothetical protein